MLRWNEYLDAQSHEIGATGFTPGGYEKIWLNYREAAQYIGFSVKYLRNLVSDGLIPVYGPLRRRRFRRDMLDLFIKSPDVALRKFLEERA